MLNISTIEKLKKRSNDNNYLSWTILANSCRQNEATHLISRFNFPLRNFSDSNPPAENRSLTSAFPNSGRAAVSTFHRHAFRRSLFQVRDISLVTP